MNLLCVWILTGRKNQVTVPSSDVYVLLVLYDCLVCNFDRLWMQVRNNGGVMEMSDLEGYTVLKQQPVLSTFKGGVSFLFPSETEQGRESTSKGVN